MAMWRVCVWEKMHHKLMVILGNSLSDDDVLQLMRSHHQNTMMLYVVWGSEFVRFGDGNFVPRGVNGLAAFRSESFTTNSI